MNLTGIHDAPHGHESHVVVSHLSEAPVLSRPHVHHPASVVGLLVHQPVAVHHVAGLAVGHAVTVHDGVAVIHQLVHLTSEVLPLVDLHPVVSPVLIVNKSRKRQHLHIKIQLEYRSHYLYDNQ